jgi:two-component system, sensor histidine kinase
VADAAKADATGLVLRDEPFSPQELAHSVARSLAARGQAKVLDVNIDIAKRLPGRVSGDEVRLRRALEVKFTERGGIGFAVSSAALGSGRVRLTFAVTDSGMGIAAADLKRLFRPFAQASEEVARRYGGVGLGFVLVKRIAKAMGGDLVVASKPGRSSTFRLTVVVRSAASAVRRRVTGSNPLVGLRVLSVEDSPYGGIVHGAVLRELGHTVSFVGSGEVAVETVARNEHDIVLVGVALSGIDGIEATRRIRTLTPPAGRIPIIGLSGRTETHDAAAAKAAGIKTPICGSPLRPRN